MDLTQLALTGAELAVPLVAFIYGYGVLHTRVSAVEKIVAQAVTRVEFTGLKERLDDVVEELRGIRKDIVDIIRGESR